MPSNLNNKLIRVERTLNIYTNSDNSLIKEINIDEVPFDVLEKIVAPKVDDPLLYDGYVLSIEQIQEFNKVLRNSIVPDFKSFFYVLECGGIYDWEQK